MAVGQVTINRVNSPKFPNTICDVVYQKYQFSWTAMKLPKPRGKAWILAQELAQRTLDKGLPNFPALYFHNHSVRPGWKKRIVATIGGHVFYA